MNEHATNTGPPRCESIFSSNNAPANPPGFDDELTGLTPGAAKSFTVHYPADYAMPELAGKTVAYDVAVKAIRRKELPALDDAYAREVGEFDSLAALRDAVRHDLEAEAARESDAEVRQKLVDEIIEFLAPTDGVERLRVTDEDEYFPPPRQLRELQKAVGVALSSMLGGPLENAFLDDRALPASAVLESLRA